MKKTDALDEFVAALYQAQQDYVRWIGKHDNTVRELPEQYDK